MLTRPCQVMGRWKSFLAGKTTMRELFFCSFPPGQLCIP